MIVMLVLPLSSESASSANLFCVVLKHVKDWVASWGCSVNDQSIKFLPNLQTWHQPAK
jgi:hypothetical protein